MSMSNLARALAAQGQNDEASDLFERALRSAAENLNPNDTLPGSIQTYYGDFLISIGRLDDAEAQLLVAHDRLRAAVGDEHRRTIKAVESIIRFYEERGSPENASVWREMLAAHQEHGTAPESWSDDD
jgi:hypothetical protein